MRTLLSTAVLLVKSPRAMAAVSKNDPNQLGSESVETIAWAGAFVACTGMLSDSFKLKSPKNEALLRKSMTVMLSPSAE